MTLRLNDDEADSLRRRADLEAPSMQQVDDFVIDVVTHRLDDVAPIAAVVQAGTSDSRPPS
jgi:uncharacterized protein (DUF1778 family)